MSCLSLCFLIHVVVVVATNSCCSCLAMMTRALIDERDGIFFLVFDDECVALLPSIPKVLMKLLDDQES